MRLRSPATIAAISLAGLCFLLAPLSAFGQRIECRKPTAQEIQATEKAQRVLQQVLEGPVIGLGWKLQAQKSDQVAQSVATDANPKRPLMSCWPIYDATFDLTAANPRYAALRSAAEKGTVAATNWMAGCMKAPNNGCDVQPDDVKAGERAAAASHLEIGATENSPYMRLSRPEPPQRLDVPGAAIAYDSPSDDKYLVATTICVGPWKPEIAFGTGGDALFPFHHPPGTPFIENLCVKIMAASEMADEILYKVNWQQLNESLTQ